MRIELPNAGRRRHLHHEIVCTVAPILLGRIFFGSVLRVVNDNVGAGHEQSVSAIVGVQDGIDFSRLGVGPPKRGGVLLVIAEVEHRDVVRFDLVPDRCRRMVQEDGADANTIDVVRALRQLPIRELRAELSEFHRKIRVLHLAGHGLRQGRRATLRSANREAVPRNKCRREKWEPLDMVPVHVAEENAGGYRFGSVGHQVHAESADTGAAVADQALTLVGDKFHARCVAAEADG